MKIFISGFIAGIIITLGFVLIPRYFSPNKTIHVRGIVRYSPLSPLHVSYAMPEGYYIESKILFYLDVGPEYKDKTIDAKGTLSVLCGRDDHPCFPLLQVSDIQEIESK